MWQIFPQDNDTAEHKASEQMQLSKKTLSFVQKFDS
jgi:hypothetical protein